MYEYDLDQNSNNQKVLYIYLVYWYVPFSHARERELANFDANRPEVGMLNLTYDIRDQKHEEGRGALRRREDTCDHT